MIFYNLQKLGTFFSSTGQGLTTTINLGKESEQTQKGEKPVWLVRGMGCGRDNMGVESSITGNLLSTKTIKSVSGQDLRSVNLDNLLPLIPVKGL